MPLDKFLNPITALDALHAIDVELHMVTQYGPTVGTPYDQISAEHVYAAKMMVEALIKSQKTPPFTAPRYDLEHVVDIGQDDHHMQENPNGEWVKFADVI